MLPIKGWQKTCMVDFPPYTASTIFLGGCNFKCGFCHNPDLVLDFSSIPDISQDEILNYLSSKKMWIDGVCITGGEPCLYPDLPSFISKLKGIGMLVKLDTNGTNPAMLKELIDKKMVDRVAMDIKSSLEKYDSACGVGVDTDKIKESAKILMESSVDYEFRTTVVPGLVDKEDISKIGSWLKGAKKYAIQNFQGKVKLVDNRLQNILPYSKKELLEMEKIASSYFNEVEVRD